MQPSFPPRLSSALRRIPRDPSRSFAGPLRSGQPVAAGGLRAAHAEPPGPACCTAASAEPGVTGRKTVRGLVFDVDGVLTDGTVDISDRKSTSLNSSH